MADKVKKVVLAYSGGLDTSVILPWIRELYGCEVIAYSPAEVKKAVVASKPDTTSRRMRTSS